MGRVGIALRKICRQADGAGNGLAIGLLVMMYPILCKVRFEALHHVFGEPAIWVQIAFSVVVNWIVAPFLMVRMSP